MVTVKIRLPLTLYRKMYWITNKTLLIFLLLFCGQILALEIIESSDENILVKEGDPIDLFCDTDDRYLWCYWLKVDDGAEYLTTSHKEEEGEVSEPAEDGFVWIKSKTKCGLRMESVERGLAGQWKCQLSNTDAENAEKMKDEKYFQVVVGWEAQHQLSVSGPNALKLDSSSTEAIQAVEGEEMMMECDLVEEGTPPAVLTISLETCEGEVIQQAETCEAEEEACEDRSVRLALDPTQAHKGAVVRCVSQQRGLEQEVLYESELSEGPLEVLVAPTVLWESTTHLVYQGEELLLEAKFRAKPTPAEGEVRWYVMFPSNDTYLELSSDAKLENADIILEPFTKVDADNQVDADNHTFLSLLHVSHVISNLTIEFQIHNIVGKTSGMYQVILPPPPPPTTMPAIIEEHETIEEYEDNDKQEDIQEEISGSGDDETVIPLETDEIDLKEQTREDEVTEGAALSESLLLVENDVKTESIPLGGLIGLIGGIIFGLCLVFLGFFLCRAKPKRSSKPAEVGRSKDISTSSNLSPLMMGDSYSLPENYSFPSTAMTTFGKTNQNGTNASLAPYVANVRVSPTANVLVMQLHPDESDHQGGDDLDNLSDLGVEAREDPDPLASWEDLEPGIDVRRSRNLEELDIESSLFAKMPRPISVKLSGPTGYPITIHSPNRTTLSPKPRLTPAAIPQLPSPRNSSVQLLHLHIPQ